MQCLFLTCLVFKKMIKAFKCQAAVDEGTLDGVVDRLVDAGILDDGTKKAYESVSLIESLLNTS